MISSTQKLKYVTEIKKPTKPLGSLMHKKFIDLEQFKEQQKKELFELNLQKSAFKN